MKTIARDRLRLKLTWLLAPASLFIIGCAGPTSPFGGLSFWSGDGTELFRLPQSQSAKVHVVPERQNLHMPYSLQVATQIKANSNTRYRIYYNRRDISETFKRNMGKRQPQNSPHQHLIFADLRLPATARHDILIQVEELDEQGRPMALHQVEHPRPICHWDQMNTVHSTAPFEPDQELLKEIQTLAKQQGINPSLITGLIAQESGFDPKALSRARALGLTQVTPLADEQLRPLRPNWARDARIESLPIYRLRRAIEQGQLTARQDWRLEPSHSVEGGLLYIRYLLNYWRLPENAALLQKMDETQRADVILASYNSGAARVKRNLIERKESWLQGPDLKEAMKYVNKVSSYCHHFASNK